jgi:hypothetical protein
LCASVEAAPGDGDSLERLRKQTTDDKGSKLRGRLESRPDQAGEPAIATAETGEEQKEGAKEEKGVDLLWWMDSKHRAKTADEQEAER